MYHYDSLPYQSDSFPETHPRSLAMLAWLLHVPHAPPQACRVLELGCAAGGNLIPMAWQLPDSEFVGVDLEPAQVEQGREAVAALGLRNVVLAQGDIAQLGDELGQFDYIVAHGVFSWVPDTVRETMFGLYRRLLQPHGIGYVSYNIRPGWHVRGMLREMLLFHTRGIDDPREALGAAAEYLELYAETLARQPGPLAEHLLLEVAYLRDAHPSYLFHEYLEENNRPLLFSDVAAMAERHRLRYLCESSLERMFPSQLGEHASAFLDGLDDAGRHEQYLDFFNNRTFRQSLLVHAAVEPDYDIDLARIEALCCASDLVPPQDPLRAGLTTVDFATADGKTVAVEDPVARAMLWVLYRAYPSALPLAQVHRQALAMVADAQGTAPPADGSGWQIELFTLFANGLVRLTPDALAVDNRPGERPRAQDLARLWAQRGAPNIPNLWHRPVNTDAFARRLLGLLDGTRGRDALVESLLTDLREGSLALPGAGQPADALRQTLGGNVERLLTLFARNGLLMPSG